MKFEQDLVFMSSIEKSYEDKKYKKGSFYDTDTATCYDFYVPNELVSYIDSIKPLTEVNCELQVKQKINNNGTSSLSVRLLNIDGVLSNE